MGKPRNIAQSSPQARDRDRKKSRLLPREDLQKKIKWVQLSRSEMMKRTIQRIKQNMNKTKKSNGKQLKKKFKKFIEGKQKKYDGTAASTEFTCPICLDMIMTPSPTFCGHIFCYRCIEEATLRQSTCPVCRSSIRTQQFYESKHFASLSKAFWQTSDQREAYFEKVKLNKQWLQSRFVKAQDMKVGTMIDIRDTEFIWCQGTIRKIVKERGVSDYILIHYMGWNIIYDEVIEINSQRIAPYGFFFQRDDIPHYRLNEAENNMRSRIDYPYSFNFPDRNRNREFYISLNRNWGPRWNILSANFGINQDEQLRNGNNERSESEHDDVVNININNLMNSLRSLPSEVMSSQEQIQPQQLPLSSSNNLIEEQENHQASLESDSPLSMMPEFQINEGSGLENEQQNHQGNLPIISVSARSEEPMERSLDYQDLIFSSPPDIAQNNEVREQQNDSEWSE